jgi:hypothetical protein
MLKRGIENNIERGMFREINATLVAVMLLGLQDYRDYLLKDMDEQAMDILYEDVKDVILYGIIKK